MTKENGLGWTTFSIDNSGGSLVAIVNDVTNASWQMPRAVQDVTGLDKSAIERLHLLADFSCDQEGVFNDEASKSHTVFQTLANTRTHTIVVSGNTLSNEVLLTDYALTRSDSGELTWKVPAVLQSGTLPAWSP
jgi:mRNA-degrading endonuclease HigB of HigAB toxin-antitoxin module